MQLLKLHIESYRHLENLTLNFVYPENHTKSGQPLEKICLIGQSATGKTTLLDLIKNSATYMEKAELFNGTHMTPTSSIKVQHFTGSTKYLVGENTIELSDLHVKRNDVILPYLNSGGGAVGNLLDEEIKLYYFTSDLITKGAINILNQNPTNFQVEENQLGSLAKIRRRITQKTGRFIVEFNEVSAQSQWLSLLHEILLYRKKFTQMASEIINKGVIADITKLNKEFQKWSQTNVNPLVKFADYVNPILEKLNLEVDLVNTEYPIPIKLKHSDSIIPIQNLSTGTKSLMLSIFPLFELDTNNAIVLIDEPERSLFPDIQIDLIENYKKIAPKAQLIVATHSPFIAASFEPEERFILYFDENGKVAVRQGESPIGDDPNDILSNDFKVNYYNSFGQEAYRKYISLKEKMASETNPQKKKELLKEVSQLGDEYKF